MTILPVMADEYSIVPFSFKLWEIKHFVAILLSSLNLLINDG